MVPPLTPHLDLLMPLKATEVKYLTCPSDKKQIKKADGNGLFILVKSNGSKLWRMKYKFAKKHQELALGKYPSVTLSDARKSTEEARSLLIQGINPAEMRRERKITSVKEDALFYQVAIAWWEKEKSGWSDDYVKKIERYINIDLKPLSKKALDKIDFALIADVLIAAESKDTPRKASPILSVINRIFNYALANRLTSHNPAMGVKIREILKPMPKIVHRSAILDIDRLANLIRDIDENDRGSFCSSEALKLIPRIFLRPGEVRMLRWEHVNFKEKRILLPANFMKMDREFIVPLSSQVLTQLETLKMSTGYSELLFPNANDSVKPMSKNVLTNRLRDLGYEADVMSAHGFRASASTTLVEQLDWDPEVVDVQLSHLTGTATSRAYNRAIHLKKRTKMMQEWSDYLDSLKNGEII
jgi:integrase